MHVLNGDTVKTAYVKPPVGGLLKVSLKQVKKPSTTFSMYQYDGIIENFMIGLVDLNGSACGYFFTARGQHSWFPNVLSTDTYQSPPVNNHLRALKHVRLTLKLLVKMFEPRVVKLLVKTLKPRSNADYNMLLDSKEEPLLEDPESNPAFDPPEVKKAKLLIPHNTWIFHLALITLYSTVFILMTQHYHAKFTHGPSLIFCTSASCIIAA